MDVLKSWALSVTAAAAVTAAVSFLSPSGMLDKSIKTVAGLFMLICFILPFVKTDINNYISADVEGMSKWLADSKVKKEAESEIVSMLEKSIYSRISAYLKNDGVEKSKINVKVNIDESNNIKIKKISIDLFEEISINDLKKFVESEFEITPEITLISEE